MDNKFLNAIESLLMTHDSPLSIDKIHQVLNHHLHQNSSVLNATPKDEIITKKQISLLLTALTERYQASSIELIELASGYRLQVRAEYADWVSYLLEEKPQKYSRALLETLVLIAYKQPITRSEIESVRGVGVSSQIIRTLMERQWIKISGHKEVPGKPALYSTTAQFLDYFSLKSLKELPQLEAIAEKLLV